MFKLSLTGTNIIFVDFDGPLLPARMHLVHPNNSIINLEKDPECKWQDDPVIKQKIKFDSVAISVLNDWIDKANAKIVLSTNWTKYSTREELLNLLSSNGLNNAEDIIHDDWKTVKHKQWTRADEISYWMSNHRGEISGYLMLDDDISIINHPHLDPKRAILVDFFNGIQWNQVFEGYEVFGIIDYK